MLGSQDHVCCSEHGVGPSGEDGDDRAVEGGLNQFLSFFPWRGFICRQHREAQRCTLAPADPVLLGFQRCIGPINGPQVVQETLAVVGDPKEPLRDVPLFHRGVATLT